MRSPLTALRSSIEAPQSKYGFKLYLGISFSYGWAMFGLNLLTILLCAPIITAPAAICALNRVLMKITLDGKCQIMREYFSEFKSSFVRVLPFFSIGTALSIGIGLLIYNLLFISNLGILGYSVLALCVIACIFIYLVFTYAVILFVTVDLAIGTNIKNALLLTLSQPKRDIYIIIMPLAITVLSALFLPKTIAIFVLLIPAFTTLMSCCIVKPVLEDNILLTDEEQ